MADLVLDRDELLRLEASAFEQWSAATASLDPSAERGDGWTLADVVAHISGWQRFSVQRLRRLSDGEVIEPPDWDAFNAELREAARSMPWEEIAAEAVAARAALLATVRELDQATLERADGLGAFIFHANGADHYAEHLHDFDSGAGGD